MHESENDDGLTIKRIAGGSIIDHPPIFSPDGELLFVIFKNLVHSYSTVTGEWVRDLEGFKDDIIGLQYENNNSKLLIACSRTGEVIRWKWKTATIENKYKLPLRNCTVNSFHIVQMSPESLFAFVTYRTNSENFQSAVVDILNGRIVRHDCVMGLKSNDIMVAVEKRYFHYIAVIQGHVLYLVDYKNWHYKKWYNAQKEWFTYVRCHPTEELVATGDGLGRIFLWRQIFRAKQPVTTLYHWHHTPITSVSFTESGTNFYSSGLEAVLVKWNMDRPDLKQFLPRVSDSILHIEISDQNKKIVICTADNAIQVLGPQNQPICVLQNFTFVWDKKTGLDRFPIGLQINPRTKTLVLNGRIGHIQFYSTYTRSLLYNMDVVLQNRLSIESKKILYDIRVTNAAFNIDWMVTGEVWDDQEHNPESTLKFWEFNKENQNYVLNTNIESPHGGGFQAITFSNQYQAENLLCATVGKDNFIKMWSLEDSTNIYKKGKAWYCIGKTSYKNFPIESIHFSQDGSLLAAGFGNSLCIYKSNTLKLKVSLTAPPGTDGSIGKAKILLPKTTINKSKKSPNKTRNHENEKEKLVLNLFQSFLEENNTELVTKLKKEKRVKKINEEDEVSKPTSSIILSNVQKEIIFKKVLAIADLNLFQKIDLYQKLQIFCTLSGKVKNRLYEYMMCNILNTKKTEDKLRNYVKRISVRHRFKAKYRLENYLARKHCWNAWSNKNLVSISDILNFDPTIQRTSPRKRIETPKQNGFCHNGEVESEENEKIEDKSKQILPPVQDVANIKYILFGSKEYAHLIVVCTKHRILIWDLLTLRLQSVLKLSADKITVDPMTGVFAVFTIYNELYVFTPNAPIPLYHRTNMPKIHGAAWVPRRIPKTQSLNIDWQAISILYFLTDKQEICCLLSESDVAPLIASASFTNDLQDATSYSVFGRYAINQMNATSSNTTNRNTTVSIGVPGKASIKSLIETAAHTMAPVNLLSNDFLKSLLITENDQRNLTCSGGEDDGDVEIISDDDEKHSDSEFSRKIEARKLRMAKVEISGADDKKNLNDSNFKHILKEDIDLVF